MDIIARFETGADYIAYRHAFGTPSDTAARRDNKRILAALTHRLERLAPDGAPFDLHWTISYITAHRGKPG
jgi:hypothetical protein